MTLVSRDRLMPSLKRFYGHFSPRRKRQLALLIGMMLVGAVAELMTFGAIIPFLALMSDPGRAASFPMLQDLFTILGWNDPNKILVPATLLFILLVLLAGSIRLLLFWVNQKYAARLGYDLSVDVYSRTLYQPYSYHISTNSSEIIAGINKVQSVIKGVLAPILHSLTSLVISFSILSALLVIDIANTLAAIVGFSLIYIGINHTTRKRLKVNSHVIAKAQGERIKTINEGIGGIRDVLIDQAQRVYVDNFSRVDLALRDAQMINSFIGATPRYVLESLGMVLIAGLALSMSLSSGGLTVALPVLGALAFGAQRLLPMFQLIYESWTRILGTEQMLFDVNDLLDMPIRHKKGNAPIADRFTLEDAIELKELSFRYSKDGQLVLNNINLLIDKGSQVGFIGRTGSGKSTILDLVMGLLEPTCGAIIIDGTPLSAENVRDWQMQIAHVPQAIYLSDTTIAENIAFCIKPDDIDMVRIRDAARRAEIASFIEDLPGGYQTTVGERGVRLSGGQRQRIGIARALYKRAEVLIFDEATSALDESTEAAVMASINALDKDLTILIIAHRLSTIEHCDKIVRLDGGRVAAQGSYDKIVRLQQDIK